jgi:hypothetical protein
MRFHANLPSLKIKPEILPPFWMPSPARTPSQFRSGNMTGNFRHLTFNPRLRTSLSAYEPQQFNTAAFQ